MQKYESLTGMLPNHKFLHTFVEVIETIRYHNRFVQID